MKYTQSGQFRPELQAISDVLELINYRSRTIDSYLQSIFECCRWLEETCSVSLGEASVPQLRSFLLHLKRSRDDGGKGYAPRSVNIYNCAIKKYFRFVLRKPLTNDDLPLCKVDHPLPKVPCKKEIFTLILGTRNLKPAEQGHGLAMKAVGVCYQFGEGVEDNMKEAIKWYEKALEVIDDLELARKVMVFKTLPDLED